MRSRYSAYALGEVQYLLDTWDAFTRPATLELDPELRWVRLDIHETNAGGPFDREGTVAFTAFWRTASERGEQREVSTFRRTDRWRYIDGT